LAHSDSIEASYIYQHGSYYYLFVNWGVCCRGTNSTYNVRVGRSAEITGPYLDRDGVDMLKGGGTLFMESKGKFIGPGHTGIIVAGGTNWVSCHFYDASRRGLSTLAILPMRWTTNDWPQIIGAE
jgi:arabinan endo-1,5-alpha-L-arabinosidase